MRKQVLVSDLTGDTIPDGEEVKVTITTSNGERYEMDAGYNEIGQFLENARRVKRRGRPPKNS